jgi:hypothetical protein
MFFDETGETEEPLLKFIEIKHKQVQESKKNSVRESDKQD